MKTSVILSLTSILLGLASVTAAPTDADMTYVTTPGSLFTKRLYDACTGVPCKNRSDCVNRGCDNGCNTNNKCHPNITAPCARNCKWNKAKRQQQSKEAAEMVGRQSKEVSEVVNMGSKEAAEVMSLQRKAAAEMTSAKTPDSLFAKRVYDECTSTRCSKRADCDAMGCDNGCNTNGKCHPNVFAPCARGCKWNKAKRQLQSKEAAEKKEE